MLLLTRISKSAFRGPRTVELFKNGNGVFCFRRRKSTTTAAGEEVSGASHKITPLTKSTLLKLCAVASIPFIGFGFADNFVMIIAGDIFDNTFCQVLGFSTLAAAGLGNTVSDAIGIGAGGMIERISTKLGINEPNLTKAQLASSHVKRTRLAASVIGMSFGCLVGMTPLMFMSDRKSLYFNDNQLRVYETYFQPFGVSGPDFFALMKHSKWKSLKKGSVIVPAGSPCDNVILLHSGAASAYGLNPEGDLVKLYNYRGRGGSSIDIIPSGQPIRGSVIGGSAIVDPSVLDKPYPSTIVATEDCEYVVWKVAELRKQMEQHKAVEAAVFSTLYLDLVEGIKQRKLVEEGDGTPAQGLDSGTLREFAILMQAILADGRVHPSERAMVREFMASRGVTSPQLVEHLGLNGWTKAEWDSGVRKECEDKTSKEVQDKIQQIPELMKKSGIRSRLTTHKPKENESGEIAK